MAIAKIVAWWLLALVLFVAGFTLIMLDMSLIGVLVGAPGGLVMGKVSVDLADWIRTR